MFEHIYVFEKNKKIANLIKMNEFICLNINGIKQQPKTQVIS